MLRADRDNPEYREKNRAYQNEWYHKNKASALETRRRRYRKLRQQVSDYKSSRGCSKCAETHPACLDFHHPDPSTKEMGPREMITKKGWTFEKLKAEFDTLEVLCANCHRKVHYDLRQDF